MPFGPSDGDVQAPPSAVNVCGAASLLVTVIVVPALTVMGFGENAKLWMETDADPPLGWVTGGWVTGGWVAGGWVAGGCVAGGRVAGAALAGAAGAGTAVVAGEAVAAGAMVVVAAVVAAAVVLVDDDPAADEDAPALVTATVVAAVEDVESSPHAPTATARVRAIGTRSRLMATTTDADHVWTARSQCEFAQTKPATLWGTYGASSARTSSSVSAIDNDVMASSS